MRLLDVHERSKLMKLINYVTGDATQPIGPGPKLIVHVCNDEGAWGAGFVMAISARDRVPESAYRLWSQGRPGPFVPSIPFALGKIQVVPMNPVGAVIETYVVNMIAQCGVRRCEEHEGGRPLSYSALRECLSKVQDVVDLFPAPRASVHMPRIGCGLAGGEWYRVEEIILQELSRYGTAVTVYDLA